MKISMRRFANTMAVWLLLSPLASVASPQELQKAEALLREGKAAEAYALLEPLEIKYAGELEYDYLLATASLGTGRPSKATFIYERILAVNPDYVGVRADMGRAYHMMGDYAKAKIEFEAVLAFSNTPPDLRTAVDQYMNIIEQRRRDEPTPVYGHFEVGVGSDSNALAATSARTISYANGASAELPPESRKRGNSFRYYVADAEMNHTLDDKEWSLYAGGQYRARHHFTLDTADSYQADVRAGATYASGRMTLRGGLTFGRYWLDNVATRDSYGANAQWRLTLDENANSLSLDGSATRLTYLAETQRINDYDFFLATLGWTHAIASSTISVLSLSVGHENATGGRLDGDKNQWGLRGHLSHVTDSKLWSFFTTLTYQPGRYKLNNTDFNQVRRDELSELGMGVYRHFPDRWSLRLGINMSKNRSNLPINAYSRTDTGIVLRKDF